MMNTPLAIGAWETVRSDVPEAEDYDYTVPAAVTRPTLYRLRITRVSSCEETVWFYDHDEDLAKSFGLFRPTRLDGTTEQCKVTIAARNNKEILFLVEPGVQLRFVIETVGGNDIMYVNLAQANVGLPFRST